MYGRWTENVAKFCMSYWMFQYGIAPELFDKDELQHMTDSLGVS